MVPRKTPEEHWRIIQKWKDNPDRPKASIARECGVSPHCVFDAIKRYTADPNDPNPTPLPKQKLPRPGARKVPPQVTQGILDFVGENRFASAAQIKKELDLDCSVTTVMRRLAENGIHCHRPARKPRLSDHHREERRAFARRYAPPFDWRNVMFTDECTISSSLDTGVQWVRRRRGARYEEANVLQVAPRSGRVSIPVWANLMSDGPVEILRITGRLDAKQYHNRIVLHHVAPALRANPDLVFQQDNSPVHTAIKVQNYLKNFNVIVWPAASPDLSPIENFWDLLKREIGDAEFRGTAKQKEEQLWRAIQEAFNRLKGGNHLQTVANYYASMPRRLDAVIAANGGHTRY